MFLSRGDIYTIENKTFLCIGGAKCFDTSNLIKQKTWWKESIVAISDINNALSNLKNNNMNVDYVISHTCPSSIINELELDDIGKKKADDESCNLLEFLRLSFNFKHWYFGHFHDDKNINDTFTMVHLNKIKIF